MFLTKYLARGGAARLPRRVLTLPSDIAALEPLEGRQLYTAGPETPSLTAQTIDQDTIRLTYSTSDGAHLVLEKLGPGDDNFTVSGGSLNSAAGSHTLELDGLKTGTAYQFRLRADADGLVAYAQANASTAEPTPPPADPEQVVWDAPANVSLVDLVTKWGSQSTSGVEVNFNSDETVEGGYLPSQELSLGGGDPYGVYQQLIDYQTAWTQFDGKYRGQVNAIASPYPVQIRLRLADYATSESSEVSYSPWTSPSQVTITPPGGAYPPTPEISADAGSSGTVDVDWSIEQGSGESCDLWFYRVVGDTATALSAYPITVTGSDSGTATFVAVADSKIFAFTSTGASYGAYSNYSNGTGDVMPAAPDSLAITAVVGEETPGLRLLWSNSPNNEDGFIVQRSADGTSWSSVATVGADVSSYIDKPENEVPYQYRVIAQNEVGQSPSPVAYRPFPINGVVKNATGANIWIHNDEDGWKTLAPGQTTGYWTEDWDFIYVPWTNQYFKVSDHYVTVENDNGFVKVWYGSGPNSTPTEIAALGPGEYRPAGPP